MNAQSIIEEMDLSRFFAEESVVYDLTEGTARNRSQNRVIYLSTDIIRGIYTALKDETGPAWSLILKNCGRLWGRKVALNLDAELKANSLPGQKELSVQDYIATVETYFARHGWGRLKIDLEHAVDHGVVTAELRNSIFAAVLEDEVVPVDAMIAGILASFFSVISGQELDAIEFACLRRGDSTCRFAISSEDRIADIEDDIAENTDADEVLQKLIA